MRIVAPESAAARSMIGRMVGLLPGTPTFVEASVSSADPGHRVDTTTNYQPISYQCADGAPFAICLQPDHEQR
jgi:hypothetical protein